MMTDKLNRRDAMVLGLGATATPAWTLPIGGEIDTTTQGINIKLVWDQYRNKWGVIIPDFKSMGRYWRPGNQIQWICVPLDEYLNDLEVFLEIKAET